MLDVFNIISLLFVLSFIHLQLYHKYIDSQEKFQLLTRFAVASSVIIIPAIQAYILQTPTRTNNIQLRKDNGKL